MNFMLGMVAKKRHYCAALLRRPDVSAPVPATMCQSTSNVIPPQPNIKSGCLTFRHAIEPRIRFGKAHVLA